MFSLHDLLQCTVHDGELTLPYRYQVPREMVVVAETSLDRVNLTRPFDLVLFFFNLFPHPQWISTYPRRNSIYFQWLPNGTVWAYPAGSHTTLTPAPRQGAAVGDDADETDDEDIESDDDDDIKDPSFVAPKRRDGGIRQEPPITRGGAEKER